MAVKIFWSQVCCIFKSKIIPLIKECSLMEMRDNITRHLIRKASS